jgi:hypothetical protein
LVNGLTVKRWRRQTRLEEGRKRDVEEGTVVEQAQRSGEEEVWGWAGIE